MSEKRTILHALADRLRSINGETETITGCPFSPYTYKNNVFNNVYITAKFLEQVNDFPTLCMFQVSPEIRQELGSREILASINIRIRGYLLQDESFTQSDDLIEDIQYAVNSLKYVLIDSNLVDTQISQVSTDEGLLDPHGIVEISVLVIYKLTV